MNSIELVAKAIALGIQFPEVPTDSNHPYDVDCQGVSCFTDSCPFNLPGHNCSASTAEIVRDAQAQGAPLQNPDHFKHLYPEYFL